MSSKAREASLAVNVSCRIRNYGTITSLTQKSNPDKVTKRASRASAVKGLVG